MTDTAQSAGRRSFGSVQAILALATVLMVIAWFAPLRSATITVAYTTDGTVLQTADGGTRVIAAGEIVGQGDRVVVPSGGALTLSAPDGHSVSLVDSTEVTVKTLRQSVIGGRVQTRVDVDDGSARISGTGRARTSLDIGLPNGLAGVRGTDFGVRVQGTQTLISVHEGAIEVEDASGATLPVSAGEGVVVTATGAAAATLPGSPAITAPATGATVDSIGTTLDWSAVPQAASYLIEIALDDQFLQMLQNLEVTGPGVDVPTLLQDGPVFLRVAARSADGLQGQASPPIQLDIRLRLAQGLQFQAGGDLLSSISEFEAAVANYPTDVTLIRDLAWALYLDNRYADARPYYETAVELEPDDATTMLELARVYVFLEEYDLAESTYTEVLEAEAQDADALWGLAEVMRLTGRTAEGIDFAERALAAQPDHPYAAETLRQLRSPG